jgi:hypothetical protein
MLKKAKLLHVLAFSVTLLPVAEVAAIAVGAQHNLAMSAAPPQHRGATVEVTVAQDPFSVPGQSAHAAGSELILVNSTPVWTTIH